MNWLYLLALLTSWAGMLTVDFRYRLVLRSQPGMSIFVIFAGAGLLLGCDLWAIDHNIFVRGESPLLAGVWLAPHLPVEEPIFLLFLCYCTLVVFAGVRKFLMGKDFLSHPQDRERTP